MYILEEHEYMLNGLQTLIDRCRRFKLSISDISIDNENKKIRFHLKDEERDLVFEDGRWNFKDKDTEIKNCNEILVNQDIYDKLVHKNNSITKELFLHLEKKNVSAIDIIQGELLKARLQGFEEALSIITKN